MTDKETHSYSSLETKFEKIKNQLPSTTLKLIEYLTFPIFIEALSSQGTYATAGDSVLKLIELHLLTSGHAKQLTPEENITFTDKSSGSYQEILARSLGFDALIKHFTDNSPRGRRLSEALEEVFGIVWAKSNFDFSLCLSLYLEILEVVSEGINVTFDFKKPLPSTRKVFVPTGPGLTKAQKQLYAREAKLDALLQAARLLRQTESDESQEIESNDDALYKEVVPPGYNLISYQEADQWHAYAVHDADQQEIPNTRASHRKKKSATNFALKLLLNKLQEKKQEE